MSTKDVAADMASLFSAGRGHEIGDKYWSDNVVSVEAMSPPGMDAVARGKAAVQAKGEWWSDNHEVLNPTSEGPFINGDQVAFRFEMEVKIKASGEIMPMREIALYTIKDDRIVEERFLYGV